MKVEFSTDEEEGAEGGSPQRITVGIEDVVRVMPWFCIEVLPSSIMIFVALASRRAFRIKGSLVLYISAGCDGPIRGSAAGCSRQALGIPGARW